MTTLDLLAALTPVVEGVDLLAVPYYIGGSFASSLYGMARSTLDVDIVADLKKLHVSKLKQLLNEEYYMAEDMIIEAIETSCSPNLIPLETAFCIPFESFGH